MVTLRGKVDTYTMSENLLLSHVFILCVLGWSKGALRDENIISDRLYQPLESVENVCVRRSNFTHEIGCQSEKGGQSGVLYLINSSSDADQFIQLLETAHGDHHSISSYVPLLASLNLLNRDVMMKLKASDKVKGVLVAHNLTAAASDSSLTQFSSAQKCPNTWLHQGEAPSSCPGDVEWNPMGSGIYYESFPFPIVFLASDADVTAVYECYSSFNEPRVKLSGDGEDSGNGWGYPLCSVLIDTFQYSSGNTDVCLRRSQRSRIMASLTADLTATDQCSPLGGLNTYGQLTSTSSKEPYAAKSVIVVASRVDANSFFYNLGPLGTEGYASGVLAMLGVMDLLKPLAADLYKTNISIIFIAFDGEFFDNSGSIRAVYDMENGVFPQDSAKYSEYMAQLKMQNIKMYIELSQVGNATTVGEEALQYYAYSTLKADEDIKFGESLKSASKSVLGHSVEKVTAEKSSQLPPSSLISFLRAAQGDKGKSASDQFPGIVITDHKGSFHNSFYGDSFDVPVEFGLNQTIESGPSETNFTNTIERMSQFVSRLIVSYVTDDQSSDGLIKRIQSEQTHVQEYAYCLLVNVNCSIINSFVDVEISQEGASNRYVTVAELPDTSSVLTIFRYLFYYALKEPVDNDQNSSQDVACEPKSANDGRFVYFKLRNSSISLKEKAENDSPNGSENDKKSSGNEDTVSCYRSPVSVSTAESPAFLSEDLLKSGKYPAWTESFWSSSFSVKLFVAGDESIDVMTFTIGVMITVASYVVVFLAQLKANSLFVFTADPIDQTGSDDIYSASRPPAPRIVTEAPPILGGEASQRGSTNNPGYANSSSSASVYRDELNNAEAASSAPTENSNLSFNSANPLPV